MRYNMFITSQDEVAKESPMWFRPSEIKSGWFDSEPSLDHAIKATRFYERVCGLAVKREAAGE